jgi:hypothetical protein
MFEVRDDKRGTTYFIRALADRVLAVASLDDHGDWSVYVDAVPGYNHDCEWDSVAANGDKQSKEIACVLFPYLEQKPYRE